MYDRPQNQLGLPHGWQLMCEPVLVLVDAPIENDRIPVREKKAEDSIYNLPVKLFQGGYEDVSRPAEPGVDVEVEYWKSGPTRKGLLEDLIYYWQRERPESFRWEDPSLFSVAHYPLKIVAAEWMTYAAVMDYSIKRYEYTVEDLPNSYRQLDRLNSDLQTLQAWRRRALSSLHKISTARRFISFHQAEELDREDSDELLYDYEYVAEKIDDYSHRLESSLPVVTSLVQIVDSRRSFEETSNVSRLTYLALVFVPLTFTSGLFGMNANVAPGGKHFWIYFAVAVPVTLAVFLLAQPSAGGSRRIWKSVRLAQKPQLFV